MATRNVTVTPAAWALLVSAGKEFTLGSIASDASKTVMLAVSDTEVAPTVSYGHVVRPSENESVTRDFVGPGYVYGRASPKGDSLTVTVTDWTPESEITPDVSLALTELIADLPTSSDGLSEGNLWVDATAANVLKRVAGA